MSVKIQDIQSNSTSIWQRFIERTEPKEINPFTYTGRPYIYVWKEQLERYFKFERMRRDLENAKKL